MDCYSNTTMGAPVEVSLSEMKDITRKLEGFSQVHSFLKCQNKRLMGVNKVK